MATERELKTIQEDRLFDLYEAYRFAEGKCKKILKRQIARAASGMTAEEIDAVKERVNNAIAENE